MGLLKIFVCCFCVCSFATAQNSPNLLLDFLSGFNVTDNPSFFRDLIGLLQNNPLETQNILETLLGNSQNSSFVNDLIELVQNNPSFIDRVTQNILDTLLSNLEETLRSNLENPSFLRDLIGVFQNNASLLDTGIQNILQTLVGNFENPSFFRDLIGVFQNNASLLNTDTQNILETLLSNLQNPSFFTDLIGVFQNNSSLLGNETQIGLESLLGDFITSDQVESLLRIVFPDFEGFDNINVIDIFMSAASSVLQANGVSENCRNDIGVIVTNVFQQTDWALRMVDAMGKPESGLLEGNLKWLGNYEECIDTEAVVDGEELFKAKYCKVKFVTASSEGGDSSLGLSAEISLQVGTCTSDSCSASDLNGILTTVQRLLLNGTTLVQTEVSCVEDRTLPADVIVCIGVLCMLLAFSITGTLYDAFAVQMRTDSDKTNTKKDVQMIDSSSLRQSGKLGLFQPTHIKSGLPNAYLNGGYAEAEDGDGKIEEEKTKNGKETADDSDGVIVTLPPGVAAMPSAPPTKQRSAAEKILLAFSFYSNGVKILDTHQGAGTLGAINGIRFLSMAWVILGHTYYFCFGYDSNLGIHFLDSMQNWTFMAITYATVSVDSFFTISGILVAYLTLRELKKMGGAKKLNWFMFYFHRFWRLTPPYMLVLMVGTVILPFILNGPMWDESGEIPDMATCRETWWTNLLYVNNYVKTEKLCMGWSWYLANDMQFYIISPLMLLPLFYQPIAGVVSCLTFLTATTVAAGVVAYSHRYPVQTLSPYAPPPNDADYGKNLYLPSYARLGPYVVGLFTGYLLYKIKCKCRIPKVVNLTCWFLAVVICCLCVYTPYSDGDKHIFTAQESAAFHALHRTGWGIAVCWIVFSCATGHGGWIDELLSWKAFVPLGRLTYCAYLIHPLVMLVFYMSRTSPTYFSIYEVIYLFIGNITLSYGLAFIVSLVFESPMMGLEKAIFKRDRK